MDGGMWTSSGSGRFMSATVATGKILIRKGVGERAGLNALQKGIIPAPARNVRVKPLGRPSRVLVSTWTTLRRSLKL